MDNPVQKHILRKFMYNDSLRFNEIRDGGFPSNKFDYHLKLLQERGFITKDGGRYRLTSEGVHLISGLDGVAIESRKRPIACVFVLAVDDEDRILVHERKKQPFRGVVGIPGGKLEFGRSVSGQAAEELLEETGLSAESLELGLVTNYRTVDEASDEVSHHVVGFFYLARGLSGELVPEDREGRNRFVTVREAKSLDRYPDFDFAVDRLLDGSGVSFQEADRFIRGGAFTGIEFRQGR